MSNPLMNAITQLQNEGASPEAALIYCLCWLNGGKFMKVEMVLMCNEWTAKHGEPTWKKLEVFAREHEIDANIVAPLVEAVTKR